MEGKMSCKHVHKDGPDNAICEDCKCNQRRIWGEINMSLSDKIRDEMGNFHFYEHEDVKEAVKDLKEGDINKIPINQREAQIISLVIEEINKIFGEKLI